MRSHDCPQVYLDSSELSDLRRLFDEGVVRTHMLEGSNARGTALLAVLLLATL